MLVTTLRTVSHDQLRLFLLVMFWAIFGFFTLIKRGTVTGRLDPVSWIWVEVTLVPAVVMAGARLADISGTWRVPAWGLATRLRWCGRVRASSSSSEPRATQIARRVRPVRDANTNPGFEQPPVRS